MFQPVHRIEEALRLWERVSTGMRIVASATKVMNRAVPLTLEQLSYNARMFREAPNFRADLLYAYTRDFSGEKYGDLDVTLRTRRMLGGISTLPMSLWAWTKASRRVWQISPALCTLLENTHLHDLVWEEVPWPFDSYSVTFDKPLVMDSTGAQYDCAIISRVRDSDTRELALLCVLIKTDVARYAALPKNVEKHFARIVRNGDKAAFVKQLAVVCDHQAEINSEQPVRLIATRMPAHAAHGEFLENLLEIACAKGFSEADVNYQHIEFMARLIRIVVGLNMYMAHVVPREGGASEPGPPSTLMDGSAITNKAQVCWVDVALSDEERRAIESSGSPTVGKRVHWRKGHWRRLPRTDAQIGPSPRIWIKPVLVNFHRLAEGTLPLGSHTNAQGK